MNLSKVFILFLAISTCLLPKNAFGQNPQIIDPAGIDSSAQEISSYLGGLIAVSTAQIEIYYNHHFITDPYDANCSNKELSVANMNNDIISLEWSDGTSPADKYLVSYLNLSTGIRSSFYTQNEFISLPLDNDLYLVSLQSLCNNGSQNNFSRSALYTIIVDKPVMLNTSEGCYCRKASLVFSDDYNSNDDEVDINYEWTPVQDIERYTIYISIDGHQVSFPFDINFHENSNVPDYVAVDRSCMENVEINYSETSIYIPDPQDYLVSIAAMTFGVENIFQAGDDESEEVGKFRFSISDPYLGNGMIKITRCLDRDLFFNHYREDIDSEMLILNNSIQAQPNPTNSTTTIQFTTGSDDHISLSIYNNYGQKIKTLIDNQWTSAGIHQMEVNLSDYPSGIYNCILESSKKTKHTKVLRLE